MVAPSREAAWTQIGAISPRDFFPEDGWTKDSRPQKTGEGSLVHKRLGKAAWLMVLHPEARR